MSPFLLLVLLRGAAATAPKLSVGKEFVMTPTKDLPSIDASTYAVKQNGEFNWWAGNRQSDWIKMSSKGGKVEAEKGSKVHLSGYECPAGYSNPCLLKHTAPTNVGIWPANVYKINEKEILMFAHLEYRYHGQWNVRHGLSYSNDSGNSFHWVGNILGPAGACGQTLTGTCSCSNMGLANYIIKDGFFQVYYQDQVPTGHEQGPTGDSQQVAVARAKVADVVAAAKQLKTTAWFKYHNGTWTEPGLGGDFTPVDLRAQGYMHGDAIYIKSLNQYAIVMQSGDKAGDMGDWGKKLGLSFSADGLSWSEWQWIKELQPDSQVTSHEEQMRYPSLMSYGDDNEVADETFAVVFNYRDGKVAPIHGGDSQLNALNVTVSANTIVV